ncbi:thioredoxin family protein [Oceaniferula spumae]|uniref:Thioredoxin family protein n=1 Tax=Oceaniferula spumae TaxID=2979115 RepID=A0AAT9FNJ9_9BACT
MFKSIKHTMMGLGLALSLSAVATAGTAHDFTLKNVEGKEVKLADYKDKVVVLEWINFKCPFVKKHYSKNHMPALQEKYTAKDVVWLCINSGPENAKAGSFGPAEMAKMAEKNGSKAANILLDRDGSVGKAYGAKTTPHMVVINKGEIVYEGAIDSMATADVADCEKADNYVVAALDAVLAGEKVGKSKTKGYGCSVKY